MVSSHFSRIVVIESLNQGQHHTGTRLREHIAENNIFHQRGLGVELVQADTVERFWACLAQVLQDAKDKAEYPVLHIECHGSTDTTGLVLADNSFIGWHQIKPVLTAINVATRCNLFVALAACYGAYLSQIILPTDRAPLWGMMGPTESAKPTDLLGSFFAFYSTLLASLDGDKALAALVSANARVANYYFVSAEGFFRKAYANYLANYSTEKGYWNRAKRLRTRLRDMGLRKRPSLSELQQQLKSTELPSFNKYHRQFFMIDLFPENSERFSVRFDDVFRQARSLTTVGADGRDAPGRPLR